MSAALPIVRTTLAGPPGEGSVAMLEQAYGGVVPQLDVRGPKLRVRFRSNAAGPLRTDVLAVTAGYSAEVGMEQDMAVVTVRDGRMRVWDESAELVSDPGQSFLVRAGGRFGVEVRDVTMRTGLLSMHSVGAVAEETVGTAADAVRFTSMRPVSPAMNTYWNHVSTLLTAQLADPLVEISPLVADQLHRLAASAVLAVFPNTTLTDPPRTGPGTVAPATIRRAVDYLEAHAGEPLTVADLAEQAGLSPRALHYGFRQHLGATPTEYLRRVRLERAHRDLQAADATAGVTVAGVAARWGFANPGRFSARYAAAYGRPPSRTLRG